MKTSFLIPALAFSAAAAFAQVPDSPPAKSQPASPSPADNSSGGSGGDGNANSQSSFLGKDVPFFDPNSETITWDGKTWNVTDNRVFRARFEKYLNAPAETDKDAATYDATMKQILDLLAPRSVNPKTLDQAFGLLTTASAYPRDATLCDTIANQVYAAWQSQQDRDRLQAATNALETERSSIERNKLVSLEHETFSTRGVPKGTKDQDMSAAQAADKLRLQAIVMPYDQRLAEINTLLKANNAKREIKELQTKIEFQSLIVQLFLQRRFQHVLIATGFYRNVFNDGDDEVKVKGSSKDLFEKSTGMPPTVSTVDAMAGEVIRDVKEGVDAYNYLIEHDEQDSATKRLSESFLIGEYLPPIRTLSREKKRVSLAYAQKANQLVSAIEVKDYELAEKLVHEMEGEAKDFDSSKPMAAIQTSKTVAAMHIAKAQNAAVSGDSATLEKELTAATEIWPRNPQLADVAGMIFKQGNVQNKALVDLDQLISQKNYRQIFDDRERFSAAVAFDPKRQEQLRKVLADMTEIEKAIVRAQEIEKRGDFAGAWESAEDAFGTYPTDSKLNQIRADLTTKAADFVGSLRRAEELEKRGQPGSALAWFLKAQQQYPNSDFARKGIERLTKEILPDAT
jgi:hypothetical protein